LAKTLAGQGGFFSTFPANEGERGEGMSGRLINPFSPAKVAAPPMHGLIGRFDLPKGSTVVGVKIRDMENRKREKKFRTRDQTPRILLSKNSTGVQPRSFDAEIMRFD
jgi:hypothetical protein